MAELIGFLLQVIFSRINFLQIISPFGFSFAMVRVYFGGNIFCVIFSYMISRLNNFILFSDMFVCFYQIVILTLYYFCLNLNVFKRPVLSLEIFSVFSFALPVYYIMANNGNIILFLVNFIFTLASVAYFYKLFLLIKNKTLFFKFCNLDYLYFSLFILVLSAGIYTFDLSLIYVEYFFVSLVLIFLCKIFSTDKFLIFSISMGLGASLAANDFIFLVYHSFLSVILINFKNKNKFLYAFFYTIISCLVLVWCKANLLSIILAILPAVIFVIFKTKTINRWAELFEVDSLNFMCEDLRKNKILKIKNKLNLMSNTLMNMQKDFKFLLIGKISREKASSELAQDVINSCCKNCENFQTCFFANINKKYMFERLLSKAIEVGKVSREDVVVGLQAYCLKENIIVSQINQLAEAYLEFENSMKTEDMSKLMIANNLENFASIFSSFSKFIEIDLKNNKTQSTRLKECLIANMVDAKEVVVLENSKGIESINLIAQNEHILKREMIETISRFSRTKLKLGFVKHTHLSGLSFASFVPREKLKMNLAVAAKAKEQRNGDNVAAVKIDRNKYFVAIADGMGHGDKANRSSSLVLSLIRSMFEIGFDDFLIIESINKLLIPAALDNFSTIDACIIDLEEEVCTFVKMGASVSVIKHKNTSEIISGASLPIGIVETAKPSIIRRPISADDTIILASDGVVDGFSDIENYKNYINDIKISKLQKFVDDILFDVSFQNKKHLDDMTIIAINMLKNY